MKWIRRFLSRLTASVTRRNQEQRLKEEWEEHICFLTEDYRRSGLPESEARRQALLKFGSVASTKGFLDQQRLPWLDAVLSDVVFGWRQLRKTPVVSFAAVLTLALAIGATTSAFRLVDAVLLRSLPVMEPERLFVVATTVVDRDGRSDYNDYFDCPTFRRYRETLRSVTDAMLVGGVARQDITLGAAEEPGKISRQYVSGNLFTQFGLQPAIGRLLGPEDDVKPGAHPVAVLSYDYWNRRFARDPNVIGKTFRMGGDLLEIVGVSPGGFIGTEPGEVADVFVPAMMNTAALNSPGWSWFRMWVRPKAGVPLEQVRQPLQLDLMQELRERTKGFHSDTPKQVLDSALNSKIVLFSAAAGASRLQKEYRRPLLILSCLVALVLLVACVNLANLLMAQTATRSRELALRVSIGASRGRLVQLILLQSAVLATAGSILGALFASWSAPLVTSVLRVPEDPVRLVFTTGWRELAFSAGLTLLVTVMFGLPSAFRASLVHPISVVKGSGDRRSRGNLMNGLLAGQIALCVMVLFAAALFVDTFQRLSTLPLGFSPERVAVMDVSASKDQPVETWMQVADHLRNAPGVESASLSAWPLLSGNRWTGSVRLAVRPVEVRQPYFLEVSPGFFETMRIAVKGGRDFRGGDFPPRISAEGKSVPGAGIVNEAFARAYFGGDNPIGKVIDVRQRKDLSAPMEIIGYVRNAAYWNLREPMPPTVYVPMGQRIHNTLLVRTSGDPRLLATVLRKEVSCARSDFRVRTVQTQQDFVLWHLVRERLLATLSFFFALVSLVSKSGIRGKTRRAET